MLSHPGETRTEMTIVQHCYWPNMRLICKDICSRCARCQMAKKITKKMGLLPEKQAEAVPWQKVCIDLIGPYKVGKDKNEKTLWCLSMIDPATGWVEVVKVPNKCSFTVATLFKQTWLCRYPWPEDVILDHGQEFMGEIITMLRDDYGIKRKPITTRNPQANSMVERCHQTIGNLIRVQNLKDLPQDDPWSGLLNAVMFGI